MELQQLHPEDPILQAMTNLPIPDKLKVPPVISTQVLRDEGALNQACFPIQRGVK